MKRRGFLRTIAIAAVSAPLIVRSSLALPSAKFDPTEEQINEVLDSIFSDNGNTQNLELIWVGSKEEYRKFTRK